jgi:hypothetical protein
MVFGSGSPVTVAPGKWARMSLPGENPSRPKKGVSVGDVGLPARSVVAPK